MGVNEAPFCPKPLQKPHPPVWFGGSSNEIVNTAVKYGNGILPLSDSPLDKFIDLAVRVAKVAKDRVRKPSLASSLIPTI